MSTGISSFDTSIIKTKEWIRDVSEQLHIEDEHLAYAALRGVLHVVRDRLTVEEAAHMGAELPMLLRGAYYDGWRPAGKPEKIRHLEELFEAVSKQISQMQHPALTDPARVTQAVFNVIDRHISAGEMKDVRRSFPKELQKLFPQPKTD